MVKRLPNRTINSDKPVGDLLLLAQLPPPLHGVTAVSQRIFVILEKEKRAPVIHLWGGSARSNSSIGKKNLSKAFGFAQLLSKLLVRRLTLPKSELAYLTFTPWAHTALRDAVVASVAKLCCRRTIVHLHTQGLDLVVLPTSFRYRLINRLMRGTELIAITEGTARLATSSGIFKQVYLLSNTSDDPGEPNITIRSTITCGWLGNLDSRKGVLRFIDAIAALRKAGLPVSGRIAGGPTAELSVADVKAYSTTAGVGDVIHVIGHVGDAEKHHFFSSLDLFIYLTRHDLAPLVLIEAMSHGVIPIAFDTGGIREMMGRAFEQNVIPADSSTEQCHSTVTELVSRYAERPAFFLEHRRSARNRYLNEYSETAFQMRCKLIFFPTALTLDLTGSKNEQSNRQPAQGTLESSP